MLHRTMASRPVPAELAEWQSVDQLALRVAARLPWTCVPKDDGAPWLPTAEVLMRVVGIERAAEARLTEATEHVGFYYLTFEARGVEAGAPTRGSAAATARRIVAGQLTPLGSG